MTSLSQRIGSAVRWNVLGHVALRVLTALTGIMLARLLGPALYGTLGLVRSAAGVIGSLVGFRLGFTATRFIALYRKDDPARAAAVLHLVLLAAAIIFSLCVLVVLAMAGQIALLLTSFAHLGFEVFVATLVILSTMLVSIFMNAVQGFENFRATARIKIMQGLLSPVLILGLALIWDVRGALYGYVLVNLVVLARLVFVLRVETRAAGFPDKPDWTKTKAQTPILWSFAAPGLIISICTAFGEWFGRYMVVSAGQGIDALGIYLAAEQWRVTVVTMPTLIGSSLFPIISSLVATPGEDLRRAIGMLIKGGAFVAFVPALLVASMPTLVMSLYGDAYADGARVLSLLMPGFFLLAINTLLSQIFSSAGRRWLNAGMFAVSTLVLTVAAVTLIPARGMEGLAIALVLSNTILFVLQAWAVEAQIQTGFLRSLALPVVLLFGAICGAVALVLMGQVLFAPLWSIVATCGALYAFRDALTVLRRQRGAKKAPPT